MLCLPIQFTCQVLNERRLHNLHVTEGLNINIQLIFICLWRWNIQTWLPHYMPILHTASQVRPSSGFTCCTSHCIDWSSQSHAIHFWARLKLTSRNNRSSQLSVPPLVVMVARMDVIISSHHTIIFLHISVFRIKKQRTLYSAMKMEIVRPCPNVVSIHHVL